MPKPVPPDFGSRLRLLDEQETVVRRVGLLAEIAGLLSDLVQRRMSIAADEKVLAIKISELEAIDKRETAKAIALSPAKSVYLKTCEAAALLRCNVVTARKKGLEHGFAWKVDGGQYAFSEPELKAYLAKAG